jgi:hypothetical protein|tara:strand:+ start:8506 stop:9492 length:987 start_codon:yes stop_codon:yes gene_type:complete
VETVARRKIFRDIVRGYSTAIIEEDFVFIKHMTPHDQVELEEVEQKYFKIAEKRGVPTEKDMMDFLIQEGEWSDSKDKEIEKKKMFLESLKTARNKMVLKSAIDKQSELIQKEQNALNELETHKASLIGNTCEKYAKDRMNDFYMIKSFYKDKDLKEILFSEEVYDELEDRDIKKYIFNYNEIFSGFTEESIQYTILEEFYSPYLSFAEDSMQFYGKPFCALTYNQIRLIVYTRVIKNIFDTNENIPESIRKDPAKLLEFGSSSKEERDKAKDKLSQGAAGTLVGAKDEDYEYLGIEKPKGGVSLHEEAKKKGGTLNMQDLMKLHGVE